MDNKFPNRKGTRLHSFDYNKHGAYFITVCTEGRRCILSEIVSPMTPISNNGDISPRCNDISTATRSSSDEFVGGDVLDAPQIRLSQLGTIAENMLKQMNDFYNNISVEHYVIMPNHIHFILFVKNIEFIQSCENGASRTSPPTSSKQHASVPQFVSTFKRFCNKECGYNIWQRSFYDHIIRNQHDYEKVVKYIYENTAKWYYGNIDIFDIR